MEDLKEKIIEFYAKYKIDVEIIDTVKSLSITSLYLKVDTTKTNINKIEKLVNDLSLYICIKNITFSVDYDKGCIILQIPNKKRSILKYNEINIIKDINGGLFANIGKTTENKIKKINLCKLPHLLIAGTTRKWEKYSNKYNFITIITKLHPERFTTYIN